VDGLWWRKQHFTLWAIGGDALGRRSGVVGGGGKTAPGETKINNGGGNTGGRVLKANNGMRGKTLAPHKKKNTSLVAQSMIGG